MADQSILLVDDDRELVDSFSRWFQRKGYQTTPTYHPMQCLMMAADNKYDAAVIDIGLPDMNGLELLEELVQLKLFPVLVLSGQSKPEIQEKAMELGAVEYIIKPATLEDIEFAVEQAIAKATA